MTAINATTFECDGCNNVFDGTPEQLAEGLPFRTYYSTDCAEDDGVSL